MTDRELDIGRLQSAGVLDVQGTTVILAEVSEPRPGQKFAFIMDTRTCDAALSWPSKQTWWFVSQLFWPATASLRRPMLISQQPRPPRSPSRPGARLLVLSHFSQRYADENEFLAEARSIFTDVVAARDLATVPLPARR